MLRCTRRKDFRQSPHIPNMTLPVSPAISEAPATRSCVTRPRTRNFLFSAVSPTRSITYTPWKVLRTAFEVDTGTFEVDAFEVDAFEVDAFEVDTLEGLTNCAFEVDTMRTCPTHCAGFITIF